MIVSPAPYLPFHDRHKGSVPGLWALDPATWVEADIAFAPQMALRDRLIAETAGEVALMRPTALPALAELVDLLVAHLAAQPGYRRDGSALRRPDGVAVPTRADIAGLGRLSQEDWLILEPSPGGEYVLTAGNLCFPAGWTLAEKIGRPLTAIHDPVPDYAATLGPRVNRVFAALHVDRPLQRLNYSLSRSPNLPCPAPELLHPEGATDIFLRVERQTLRRLPRTRAVVFGVKTYLTPLTDLTAADRAHIADHYGEYSQAFADYRNAERYPRSDICA